MIAQHADDGSRCQLGPLGTCPDDVEGAFCGLGVVHGRICASASACAVTTGNVVMSCIRGAIQELRSPTTASSASRSADAGLDVCVFYGVVDVWCPRRGKCGRRRNHEHLSGAEDEDSKGGGHIGYEEGKARRKAPNEAPKIARSGREWSP